MKAIELCDEVLESVELMSKGTPPYGYLIRISEDADKLQSMVRFAVHVVQSAEFILPEQKDWFFRKINEIAETGTVKQGKSEISE